MEGESRVLDTTVHKLLDNQGYGGELDDPFFKFDQTTEPQLRAPPIRSEAISARQREPIEDSRQLELGAQSMRGVTRARAAVDRARRDSRGAVKPKRELAANEEFVEYRYYSQPDGSVKRMKAVRATTTRMKYLTTEQVDEIDNAFRLFDRDNSNTIDVIELKDAMRALGVFHKKEEVLELMTRVDKDGSGAIEREEFLALMAEQIESRNQ